MRLKAISKGYNEKDNMTDFPYSNPSNKDIPIIIPDLDIPGNIAND